VSTDSRGVYLLTYIKELAAFMGFPYWVFRLDEEQADESDWCTIHIEDYDEATIKIGVKFWKASGEDKTQALVHELTHCPLERVNCSLKDAIDSLVSQVPKNKQEMVRTQIKIHKKAAARHEEQMVNMFGVLLSKFAPKWNPE